MATAWSHESELAMIRDWFYPHHARTDPYSPPPRDHRQTAVERVAEWMVKDPSLNHIIVATASLTEAFLHDEVKYRRSHISDNAMQSIYAMAFCRFVNGLVDREVVKANAAALAGKSDATSKDGRLNPNTRGESSMYAHAHTIGLPISFVELRHQATHGKLAGLAHWRQMTRQALEWLYEKWWSRNATADPARALRARNLEKLEAKMNRKESRKLGIDHGTKKDSDIQGVANRASIWEYNADLSDSSDTGYETDLAAAEADQSSEEELCIKCRKRKRSHKTNTESAEGYDTGQKRAKTDVA